MASGKVGTAVQSGAPSSEVKVGTLKRAEQYFQEEGTPLKASDLGKCDPARNVRPNGGHSGAEEKGRRTIICLYKQRGEGITLTSGSFWKEAMGTRT